MSTTFHFQTCLIIYFNINVDHLPLADLPDNSFHLSLLKVTQISSAKMRLSLTSFILII